MCASSQVTFFVDVNSAYWPAFAMWFVWTPGKPGLMYYGDAKATKTRL